MDLLELKNDDLKAFDHKRSLEIEEELRREIALLNMKLYTDSKQDLAKQKKLKKILARCLTFRTQVEAEATKSS